MALDEFFFFFRGCEEGAHARGFRFDVCGGEAVDEVSKRASLFFTSFLCLFRGQERSPDSDVKLRVFRGDEGLCLGEQGFVGLAKLREEVQRAAEEHDVSTDGATAGKTCNGLGCDRAEDRGREVLVRGALVDQWLDIRFRKDTASRGDRVKLSVRFGQRVQSRGVGVEQCGHLVDECSGSTRTGSVHTLLGGGVKVGEFCVFTAQFDDDIDFWVEPLGGFRSGDDFLNEGDTHCSGRRQTARTGDRSLDDQSRVDVLDVFEEVSEFGANISVVAAIVGEEDAVAVQDNGFDRR